MNTQTLKLNYLPTDQNTYFNAERTHRQMAAKIKKQETESVYWACKEQGLKPQEKKVRIKFFWCVTNKRKDPDNIAFAKKFILDGLVQAGVLKNDNMNYVRSFEDYFLLSVTEKVTVLLVEELKGNHE